VTEKRDQQFFDGFMVLVGIFVGMIAGVLMLGDLVGEGEADHDDGSEQAAVIERISPIGEVALIGDPSLAAAPAPAPAAAASAPAAATAQRSGEQVYQEACALCHDAGVGGAPMIGDQAAWAPRLEQDQAVLQDHVLNGFQGDAGVMPAKGGRVDLSDENVLAAMQHLIDAASQ
jgi:cytochrome c5